MGFPADGRKIAVVLNRRSGSNEGRALLDELRDLFEQHGVEPLLLPCNTGEEIDARIDEALEEGCNLLVAGGGDGTVSAVTTAAARASVTAGVLPLGTLNHFARDLGIPLDLADAVSVLIDGVERSVDIGEVNGRRFVNNVSLGLYPHVVRERQELEQLGSSRIAAFTRAILTALGRYPLLRLRIESDHEQTTLRTPLLFVGNNDYHLHGLAIGSRERLDDGRLAVYTTTPAGPLRLVWLALRALFGRLRDAEDFHAMQVESLEVDVHRAVVEAAVDGEVVQLRPPLLFRIHAGGLRVMAPQPIVEKEARDVAEAQEVD